MRGGSLASRLVMSKCRGGAYKAGHMKMFKGGKRKSKRRTKKSSKKKKKSTKRKKKSSTIKRGGGNKMFFCETCESHIVSTNKSAAKKFHKTHSQCTNPKIIQQSMPQKI